MESPIGIQQCQVCHCVTNSRHLKGLCQVSMFPLERLPSKGLGLFWSSAERYTDMDGLTRREHHCYGHTSKIKITFIITYGRACSTLLYSVFMSEKILICLSVKRSWDTKKLKCLPKLRVVSKKTSFKMILNVLTHCLRLLQEMAGPLMPTQNHCASDHPMMLSPLLILQRTPSIPALGLHNSSCTFLWTIWTHLFFCLLL